MMKFSDRKGVTLIEALIAVTIFAIVSVVSTGILVSITQLEKKGSIQNSLYEDSRIILQQIVNEIQAGTIDYEEYYSINVLQSGRGDEKTYYGLYNGIYGSRFYDPGAVLAGGVTENPRNLGVECSYPSPLPVGDPCEVIYKESLDSNEGQNPFTGDPLDANALCDDPGAATCHATSGEVDELYIIDSTGTKKTIIARKLTDDVNDEYVVGLMRMEGFDMDQNGIIDTFSCNEEFNCFEADDAEVNWSVINSPLEQDFKDNEFRLPYKEDLNIALGLTSQFVPITPLGIDIKELKFIIHPLEDPYKAYGEDAMQAHPTVTIVMTLGLTEESEQDYPGTLEDVTVQTTVAAGVVGRINSYPPMFEVVTQGGTSWIDDINGAANNPPAVF